MYWLIHRSIVAYQHDCIEALLSKQYNNKTLEIIIQREPTWFSSQFEYVNVTIDSYHKATFHGILRMMVFQ